MKSVIKPFQASTDKAPWETKKYFSFLNGKTASAKPAEAKKAK